jgi:hypothetical protein
MRQDFKETIFELHLKYRISICGCDCQAINLKQTRRTTVYTQKGNYYQLTNGQMVVTTLYGDKFETTSEAEVDKWYEENPSGVISVKIDRQNVELFDIYESAEKSRKHLLSIRLFVNVIAALVVLNWLFTFFMG